MVLNTHRKFSGNRAILSVSQKFYSKRLNFHSSIVNSAQKWWTSFPRTAIYILLLRCFTTSVNAIKIVIGILVILLYSNFVICRKMFLLKFRLRKTDTSFLYCNLFTFLHRKCYIFWRKKQKNEIFTKKSKFF